MRQADRRMHGRWPRALGLAAMVAIATAVAAGPARASVIGVVWETQAVRHPVSLGQLTPQMPHMPASVPLARTAVTVGPDAGLALWLEPAELVRVRALEAKHEEGLRFARVLAVNDMPAGSPAARMIVHEPGLRVGDTEWYLVEPPGVGSLWHVSATKPTQVILERPRAEEGRLIWEVVRRRVLAWIERGGPMPGLPLVSDTTGLELRLRADAAVHTALVRAYPGAKPLERALVAWRKASALAALDAFRPAQTPYMARQRLDGDFEGSGIGGLVELALVTLDEEGEDEDVSSRPYRQVDAAEASWSFELEGPGVLQVEARARLGRNPAAITPRELGVKLTAGDALLASSHGPAALGDASGQPSWERALPSDRPLSSDGELVSLRRRFTVPLLAGRHTYRLELTGGPGLIRVFAMHRRGRLIETILGQNGPEDFIERAEEELAATRPADAPAAALVRTLLDELRAPLPAIRPGARKLPPLLELVALRAQARRLRPEATAAEATAARVHGLLGQLPTSVDPTLIWMLRVEFAQAFTRWGLNERASQLMDQAVQMGWPEVPEAIGGLVGAYMPERARVPVQPSLALAAAERAWRDRPVEPGRREHYLLTWRRKTRWSQLAPDSLTTAAPAAWRWLDTSVLPGACGSTVTRSLFPPGRGILYAAPLGRECWYEAAAMRSGPERPAILRVHLLTEDQQPGPITVRMGQKAWSTLTFQRVETLELAVPPGRYPVRVDAPAGTLAYVGVPEPPRLGSSASASSAAPMLTPLRRRWPLVVDGAPVRYRLPDPAHIGPVRIELRELVARAHAARRHAGEPALVSVHTDAGMAAQVALVPGPVDPKLTDLDAPALVSQPTVFVTWLPPGARELWLQVEGERALVASVSFRRAAGRLLPDEQIEDDPAAESAELPEPGASAPSTAGVAAMAGDSDCVVAAIERDLTRAIYERSRCLHTRPNSPEAVRWLVERADLFLELGRGDHARPDLEAAKLRGAATGLWRAEYEDVALRLADWRRMSHLRPQPAPLLEPTPIAPSWLALEATAEELAPWVPHVRAAREHGPAKILAELAGGDQALPRASLLAGYIRARLSRMVGDRRAAAEQLTRAYRMSGGWQLGVDALADLEDILLQGRTDSRESLASITHGLASELRARVEHAQIRRAISIAGQRSRIEPVRGVDSHAGFERVIEDARASEPDASSELDWARLAPPWPMNQGQLVRPGQGARVSFRLEQPATVWAEAFCGLQTAETCPFSVRVDGRIDAQGARMASVPRAQRTPLPAVTLRPGEHEIEIVFEASEPDARASIRFVSDRPIGTTAAIQVEPSQPAAQPTALAVRRPGQLYIARPDRPIVLNVAGPTVLTAELRASAGEATTAEVSVQPLELTNGPNNDLNNGLDNGSGNKQTTGHAHTQSGLLAGDTAGERRIALATEPDPGLLGRSSRGITLAHASQELIILPRQTAYRVTVRATGGLVHARFTLRRDIDTAPSEEPAATEIAMAPLPALDNLGPGVDRPLIKVYGLTPPPPPGRSSTLSFELGGGRADAGIDDLSDSEQNRLDAAVMWRRRLVPERLWLGVDARARWAPNSDSDGESDSQPVAGLYLSTHLRKLYGLRLDVRGRVLTQQFDGALQVAARGELDLDASLGISPSVWLIPALSFDYRYQSLQDIELSRRLEVDTQIFSNYARDHAQTLTPRASLFWVPFQDQLAVLSAQLVTNADLVSVDLIAARAAWRGMVEVVPLFGPVLELDYRVSRRFLDEHRPGDYYRHDVGAALAWTVWRGQSGRLVLGVSDRLYISSERLYRTTPTRENIFRLSLRFDWTGGRGLVDLLPRELDFDDFQEPRLWSLR